MVDLTIINIGNFNHNDFGKKNNQKLIGSPGCIQGNLFFLVDLTIHFLQCIATKKVKVTSPVSVKRTQSYLT